MSGLKNIWPVIMTGNLLSVICSPADLLKDKSIKAIGGETNLPVKTRAKIDRKVAMLADVN